MTNVVVDRSKWYRGKDPEYSALLLPTGKMCCLGFAALACGLKREELVNIPTPKKIHSSLPGDFANLVDANGRNTPNCERLMALNDNSYIRDGQREEYISNIGLKLGLVFTFVDGPTSVPVEEEEKL